MYPFFPKPVIKPLFDQHILGLKKEGDVKRKTKGETLMAKAFPWGSQCSYRKKLFCTVCATKRFFAGWIQCIRFLTTTVDRKALSSILGAD